MTIKILGSGCAKCKQLEQNTKEAVSNLNMTAEILKVQDMEKIMSYNIMSTPAIVVDEKVVSAGKLLSPSEIEALLS
jgi:small redox-active disulfide protein 2